MGTVPTRSSLTSSQISMFLSKSLLFQRSPKLQTHTHTCLYKRKRWCGNTPMVLRPTSTEECLPFSSIATTAAFRWYRSGNTWIGRWRRTTESGSYPFLEVYEYTFNPSMRMVFYNAMQVVSCTICSSMLLERGYLLPTDIGSKGSCTRRRRFVHQCRWTIFYRFGSLHANVLGLEVVLASGKVLNYFNTNLQG
jgi:D-2-hydroxyglutarate dehydrogenase